MHASAIDVMPVWPDESAFQAADPRRRRSEENDLGATWRWSGSPDAWRLAWLRDTGELYVCRADALPGSCTDVRLLAVVRDERDMEALIEGWREQKDSPSGLDWVLARVAALALH